MVSIEQSPLVSHFQSEDYNFTSGRNDNIGTQEFVDVTLIIMNLEISYILLC